MVKKGIFRSAVLLAVACGSFGLASADGPKGETSRRLAEQEARVEQLIEQLGSESHATREIAQSELARMGVDAFDALYRAQTHDDIEVKWRVGYLLRSLHIQFTREDDPSEVKKILSGYEDFSVSERESRMDLLRQLPDGQGLEALCRLVRFERSLRLSKAAALQAMYLTPPVDAETRSQWAEKIRFAVESSHRDAAQWLRVHADTLVDPAATGEAWNRLVKAEIDLYNATQKLSSRKVVRDLLKYEAIRLMEIGEPKEARDALVRWVSFSERNRSELIESFDWLADRKQWDVIEQIAAQYSNLLANDAELLYVLAETDEARGRLAAAEEKARQARALDPQNTKEHNRLALVLQQRGLFAWSEAEYRQVLGTAEPASTEYVDAALNLAEMQHDQEQDTAAAEMLDDLIALMRKDPAVLQLVGERREPSGVIARMHYFKSLGYERAGETEKQRASLDEAIDVDPSDVDVLIALYQITAKDKDVHTEVVARIERAVESVRRRIDQGRNYLQVAANTNNADEQQAIRRYMAVAYNEFAWLVGNTTGDVDEAIHFSQESLRLWPENGGFYDTLAHCYYRKGDYAAAVKAQQRACQLEPHSGVIHRKMEIFRKSLEEHQ